MSKSRDILDRFGANLDESLGANRSARPGPPVGAHAAGPSRHDGTSRLKSAAEIEVDRIAPDPGQPRKEFDQGALVRLASSLTTHGQLQPIAVRWSEPMGRYLIVSGERRWRAAGLAGMRTLAAVILDGSDDDSRILEKQLIENCLREDLSPMEQARAFRELMDRNGWTGATLAETLSINAGSVTRALALLELPSAVRDAVSDGRIAPTVAYEVSKLETPEAQSEMAERIVAEKMTRADATEAVRTRSASGGKAKGRGGKPRVVTSRTLRIPGGKVTLESRRGVDDEAAVAMLRQALGLLIRNDELGSEEAA